MEFYEERAIAGRSVRDRDVRGLQNLVYLSRWNNSWDLSDSLTSVVGFSGLYGPNATGPNGDTWIYGMDMKWRWRPVNNFRGWPFLLWQSEVMQRDFKADRFFDDQNSDEVITLQGRTLHDWGFYLSFCMGFTMGGPPDFGMSTLAGVARVSGAGRMIRSAPIASESRHS